MSTVALCLAALLCGAYGQSQVVTITPLLIEGQEGEAVTFTCDIGIDGESVNIALEIFDPDSGVFGAFENETGQLIGSVRGVRDIVFTFGPLMASDNGTQFRCRGLGSQNESQVATVSVIFAPEISRNSPMGDPVVVREGESVVISLNVSGNPDPTYNWTRNDVLLTSGNGLTVARNMLTFDPASRQNSGLYLLTAQNSAGSRTYNFTLNVQYPPEFPDQAYSPETINCNQQGTYFECAASPGTPTVTFNCAAVGNPTPMVQISHPGGDNTNTTDYVITITSVRSENAGNYSCSVTSSTVFPQVNVTRMFRLYVGGTAVPVSDINFTIGNDAVVVMVEYDNSVNAVPATSFFATVSQNGNQVGQFPIDISTRSLTIPGNLLEAGQTYTVSVAVDNLQGRSEAITRMLEVPSGFNGASGMFIPNILSLLLLISVVIALL